MGLLRKIILHFFFGGAFISLFALAFGNDQRGWGLVVSFIFNGLIWVVLAFGNAYINEVTKNGYSWIEAPVKRFILVMISSSVFTVMTGYIFLQIYLQFIFECTFEKANQIFLADMLPGLITITILVSSFFHGKAFLENWRKSELESERLKKANISANYETLKNQVNPHFLFNSLNVLSTLVYKDQDLAVEFINKMSKFYRFVLSVKDKEVIPLQKELEALENYIYLLKKRFGDNLEVEIDYFETEDIHIVPLSLQMLVENAIKHNVVSKSHPLHISIKSKDGYIKVENEIAKKQQVVESMGIGIPNIKSRYQYLTDKVVEVIETTNMFSVKLPLLKIET